MTGSSFSAGARLLSLCALLRWFDKDLLVALAECGEDEVRTLLASDMVLAADDPPGSFRLRDEACAEWLGRLRNEWPLTQLTWQTLIFGHFTRAIGRSASEAARARAEADSFAHLGELFLLLAARREWQILAQHLAAARAAGPRLARHQQLLDFYDGFVAVRTQAYARGEATLGALLEQPGLDDDVRLQALNALGQAGWFQSRYDRALEYYRQVHGLAQALGNTAYQGHALLNMSMVHAELGYYRQALEASTRSLAIFRASGDQAREAHALYEMGNSAMHVGSWQQANEHFEQALQLYLKLDISAGLSNIYWSQGFLHQMLGDEAASEAAYRQALAIAQSAEHGDPAVALDSFAQLGFLFQAQSRWGEALAAYDQAIALAGQIGNQHWLSLTRYRRGSILEQQGRLGEAFEQYRAAVEGIEQLRAAAHAEEIKLGLLGSAQQVYEAIVRLCLRLGHAAEAFHYVERARSRAFLDMLGARGAPAGEAGATELYRRVDQRVATLAEVQAQLPAGALLLEYFTIGVLPRGDSLVNKIPSANARLRALMAAPPQTLIFAITRGDMRVASAPGDPNRLRPLAGDPSPTTRLLRADLLRGLRDELLAPVAGLLENRQLVYCIPHGPLHYVPFAALLGADGPALALAPSATILLRSCLGQPRGRAGGRLALGYNGGASARLRYAEAEARHIARLAGGQALAGGQPKGADLLAAGPGTQWLHIAGHAVYDPHDPLASALQLGEGETLSARAIIARLTLGADLVTLSACASGVTHVVPGDELLGLQRAFLYAGAPAVVCAQWEAADLVTLLLMDRFYAGLLAGQAPAAALRDAQAALRATTGRELQATLDRWRAQQPALAAELAGLPDVPAELYDQQLYADPIHWAAFVLIGRAD